jgi:hypothetical protein
MWLVLNSRIRLEAAKVAAASSEYKVPQDKPPSELHRAQLDSGGGDF